MYLYIYLKISIKYVIHITRNFPTVISFSHAFASFFTRSFIKQQGSWFCTVFYLLYCIYGIFLSEGIFQCRSKEVSCQWCIQILQMNLPTTVTLTPKYLVCAKAKSTRQWYKAWSYSIRSVIIREVGWLFMSAFNRWPCFMSLILSLNHSRPIRASKL